MDQMICDIISSVNSVTSKVKEDFLQRIKKGNLMRNQDPVSHFCVFFVPYISHEKKVFFGHHTKANAWIAPGGHIEPEHKTPVDTIIQEAREELGTKLNLQQISPAFFISVMNVHTPGRACGRHYSLWYAVHFEDEERFTIEEREFYDTKWLKLPEARKIVTVPENLEALVVLERMFFN